MDKKELKQTSKYAWRYRGYLINYSEYLYQLYNKDVTRCIKEFSSLEAAGAFVDDWEEWH